MPNNVQTERARNTHQIEDDIVAIGFGSECEERGCDSHSIDGPALDDDSYHWREEAASTILCGPPINCPYPRGEQNCRSMRCEVLGPKNSRKVHN